MSDNMIRMTTYRKNLTARGRARRAFTLTEMLVVIFVLAVLLALTVRVSQYLIEKAAIERTKGTMSTLMSAVGAFYDNRKEYPGSLQALRNNPASSKILSSLPAGAYESGAFKDGFGGILKYVKDGGYNGGPVIFSSGPDQQLGTDDDLRSDEM